MDLELVRELTQFGVAGLMGMLWIVERVMSRKRETQLDAAHQRLMEQREQLHVLTTTLEHNSRSMTQLAGSINQLRELMERMRHELSKRNAA